MITFPNKVNAVKEANYCSLGVVTPEIDSCSLFFPLRTYLEKHFSSPRFLNYVMEYRISSQPSDRYAIPTSLKMKSLFPQSKANPSPLN